MNYHQNYNRVSKTMLGHFIKSTSDFERYYITRTDDPPSPKTRMVIGSAIHEILLERKSPESCIAAIPASCLKSNGAINPKPTAQFRADNPGKHVMKQDEADQVLMACNEAYNHELGQILQNDDAVFELPQEFDCPHSGLSCRLMADFFLDMGDYILAYDLKTTEDIYPVGIRRTAKSLKYWLQDQHYSSGLQEIFGKPVRFRFWFLEVGHPHRIAPYEYNDRAREIAKGEYVYQMQRLAECYRNDDWRDDWQCKVNELDLSPWDVSSETMAAETELKGFDDVSEEQPNF